jgi:signal transduction histidine kinase/purine-cytosine permease-like protein/ActR/RegA family two-component response regulator
MVAAATQRILRVRRDYNTWVANETLEDYALRFAPRSFRKWSEARVAATALGSISFLALEAIGGAVMVNYGFTNAVAAILAVALVIFLTGLPISYYAAKYSVDLDLLARGAGFGYLGSTVTSLIYASFTFIFFAIEAAIMALMFELYIGLPLALGYLVSSVVVIPLVLHGITRISKFQMWTSVPWLVLAVLPFIFVLLKEPALYTEWTTFGGYSKAGTTFDPLLFGAAATVCFSLIAQIGEQVDFLRFLPERTPASSRRWWAALVLAGPGWIVPGVLKQLAGAFLAFIVIQHEFPPHRASEPTLMYVIGFSYVFNNQALALATATAFVVLSQIKINVTNAYAGSLAWSNFFSRLTHSHPGRVVWLVFNVAIALLLMEVGLFQALEQVLSLYSCIAIAWIGALVADLVINKPLGLSPPHIEFRRAYLPNINPVGVGTTLIASVVSIAAFSGVFGPWPAAFASFIALFVALLLAPLLAWITRGRFYLARPLDEALVLASAPLDCCICANRFEREDMAHCPAYAGFICSLCCSLDARCDDLCKKPPAEAMAIPRWPWLSPQLTRRTRDFCTTFVLLAVAITVLPGSAYLLTHNTGALAGTSAQAALMGTSLFKAWAVSLVAVGIIAWWSVLTREARRVAQEESGRQTALLLQEIAEHGKTDQALQLAKEAAESASLAKNRFLTDMSHELRSPLNSIIGYAKRAERETRNLPRLHGQLEVIQKSGEHLLTLADDILDIARIEAGKFQLHSRETDLPALLLQVVNMFRPQASDKGIEFNYEVKGDLPEYVRADGKRLSQVLINLVGNAVKFTLRGEVVLSVDCSGEITRFLVRDTGPGIGSTELARIFEPFQRSNLSAAGTGLGLTIARLLTELMGGELTVRSELGVGSDFQLRVLLPEIRKPDNARQDISTEDVIGYRGPRRSVLIADDEAAHRAVLVDLLAPLGFTIGEAGSGSETLRLVEQMDPDLLLLDLVMHDLSGLQVSQRLRAAQWSRPIIMVSSDTSDEARRAALDAGCNAFVAKPVQLPGLASLLQNHLAFDWIRAPMMAGGRLRMPIPPRDLCIGLVQAARVGRMKTINGCIDAMASLGDQYQPYVTELRRLAREFQLSEIISFVGEGASHDDEC